MIEITRQFYIAVLSFDIDDNIYLDGSCKTPVTDKDQLLAGLIRWADGVPDHELAVLEGDMCEHGAPKVPLTKDLVVAMDGEVFYRGERVGFAQRVGQAVAWLAAQDMMAQHRGN